MQQYKNLKILCFISRVVILSFCTSVLTYSVLAQSTPPAALVQVDKVIKQPFTETFPVLGRVVTKQAGVVAVRVSGPVEEILVEIGDRVQEGQILARLNTTVLELNVSLKQAEVSQAESQLTMQQTNLTLSQQTLTRLEELRLSKSSSFSRARYEDNQQTVLRDQALVQQAQASLSAARIELNIALVALNNGTIKAPYPGVVSQKHTEKGAYLNLGAPVVSLIDDSQLTLEANVPTHLLKGLSYGTRISVTLDDESLHTGIFYASVPEEERRTRTRILRFSPEWKNNKQTFANNQSITLHLPIGVSREILSVHKDALSNQPSGTFVFVVDETNKVQFVPIQLGNPTGGRFEVLSGLQQGDVVVIRGNERLIPGQLVQYPDVN